MKNIPTTLLKFWTYETGYINESFSSLSLKNVKACDIACDIVILACDIGSFAVSLAVI